MGKKVILVFAIFLLTAAGAVAQKVGVKTNLLYDATSTANLGVEFRLSKRWTLDVSGNYNAWTREEGKTWKHWMAQPEFRVWTCDAFSGHFFAVHGLVGQYNFGGLKNDLNIFGSDLSQLTDYRFQGGAVGAGLAYGYVLILGRHLNLEAEIGAGFIYTRYDKFNCVGCGKKILAGIPEVYYGPTKAAISLVYLF